MFYVLIWWLIIQVLGWVALPICMHLLRWLPDRGYAFSKSIGLLGASFILWIGASTGFLRNDLGGITLSVLILAGISGWIFLRRLSSDRDIGDLRAFLQRHKAMILTVEVLFAAAFVLWAILRAYATFKIMETGGEKFMEVAFLNAILRSRQAPPLDPWLSGFGISYYYFGYVMMALMTQLSGVPSGVGFDLYDALLFGLTATASFGVVYNLIATNLKGKTDDDAPGFTQSITYGLLGALLVTMMGNLEGLLESLHAKGLLPQTFWDWIAIRGLSTAPVTGSFYPGEANWLWWWRASRVLNDLDLTGQPVGASSITEFPFFSFLLGDNHPHVLALPFVLLGIALAFNLFIRQITQDKDRFEDKDETEGEGDEPGESNRPAWWNPIGLSLGGDWFVFLMYAVILGGLAFLNTWDFPIYLGLTLLVYGLAEAMRERRFDRAMLLRIAILGAGWLITAVMFYLFFYISFSSQASGVVPYVFPPTRLPQYLVIFGIFVFILGWFLAVYTNMQSRQSRRVWSLSVRWWLGVVLITLGVFALVLLVAALSDVGRQLLSGTVENPLIRSALGGMPVSEAMRSAINYRLRDPWLFMLLSGMIGVVVANVLRSLRSTEESPPEEEPRSIYSPVDYFAFLLIFTGLCLTLSTEFLYLRDSFGVRMNTVFKFYYQAWVMLGCASAYAVWWITRRARVSLSAVARYSFTAGAGLLILSGVVYTLMSSYSRVEGFQSDPDLDGASVVARNNPDDWAAIEWLQENVIGSPVILEAPGKSYNYEGRISAFTGLPAVLGWALHEGQWRGSYEEQGIREVDISTIYTTNDSRLALDLLHKYDVRYVILGNPERTYIERQCSQDGARCNLSSAQRKFEVFFEPVFSSGQVTIYAVPQ